MNLIEASGPSGHLAEFKLLQNDGYVVFLLRAALQHDLDHKFV
jgi:hypothetical protein